MCLVVANVIYPAGGSLHRSPKSLGFKWPRRVWERDGKGKEGMEKGKEEKDGRMGEPPSPSPNKFLVTALTALFGVYSLITRVLHASSP